MDEKGLVRQKSGERLFSEPRKKCYGVLGGEEARVSKKRGDAMMRCRLRKLCGDVYPAVRIGELETILAAGKQMDSALGARWQYCA